ncbi:esterase/lipase family protein [Cellulomonas edaphi]|uniref:Alpha/beta hydrolase n=1 Tax=Cellulomonas edaphi TaxID=3053468 RepID=A0ABT7S2J0_9CELL|nr:hypothetical protein [Cellulomons edaphi]MDM7829835.1 hypothetical protein [Cellulomons edaphi]
MTSPVARRAGPLRRLWWRALDYTAVGWWQTVAVLSRTHPEAFASAPAGAPTVVLLPGVYEPWRFLLPWARLLHQRGASVHTMPELGLNRGSIPAAATALGRYLADRDLRGVTLVAHSKGGLIGKLAMAQEDPDGRIAELIAVNTPFAGSRYARWFPVRAVRAFVPTNATILALATEHGANARITSAHSFWDPHVPEGSELAGAVDVVLETPGHFRPMTDPVLVELLLARVG